MTSATAQTLSLLVALSALAACSTPRASNVTTAGTQAASAPATVAPAEAATGAAPASVLMPMASHGATAESPAPQAAAAVAVEPNPAPAGGLTIAETWAKRESLSGKTVIVRGTVVKVNNGILGFNWLHVQDGSGKAADGTNDLTVTTDVVVKVGDIVTATGALAVKKDFGAGYVYEAILEKATIK